MSTTQQPEALRYAKILENFYSGIGRRDAIGASAELRRQHARIAELEARIKTMAEEHADELMVAHLDGRMRAAQPAGAQQPGAAYAALPGQEVPSYSDDALLMVRASELRAFADATHALRASHGQAPAQAAPAAVAGPSEAVAYLDIGAGGYLDLGTDLSNEALSRLPKGRHALVIAGTYGIDGYTAAPNTQAADSVLEDAERYRWLRQEHERVDPVCHLTWKRNLQRDSSEWVNTAVLDTAIDNARKQGANHD